MGQILDVSDDLIRLGIYETQTTSAYGISPGGGEVLRTRFWEEADGFHAAWGVDRYKAV